MFSSITFDKILLSENKITVLFVEHDMEIIKKYAKRLLAFYDGSVIADGETEEILKLTLWQFLCIRKILVS